MSAAIDIPIIIGNTAAYARIEEPAPIEALEYTVLDGRRQPSVELAQRLLNKRTFDSVEDQIAGYMEEHHGVARHGRARS